METSKTRQGAMAAHRQVRASTTLNRKYVKRPGQVSAPIKPVKRSVQINHFSTDVKRTATVKKIAIKDEKIQPAKAHPAQVLANQKLRERRNSAQVAQAQATKLTAKELKERAIKKALLAAEKQTATQTIAERIEQDNKVKKPMKIGVGRIVLALSAAAAVIFGIVYLVNINMPDIQFRAVAMQLNASYPNYLPYNYSPSEIASENNIITIVFKKKDTDNSFAIIEEKSFWDSSALLNNYIKDKYGDNYTILREQGLTIYVSGSNAAWVNGGIIYKLEMRKGSLSKKQISDIAVSF